MALRITRIESERSLRRLARRVYRIQGPGSNERLRLAESALLRANPRLAQRSAFRKDSAIIIPDVAGLETAADLPTARSVEQEAIAQISASASTLSDRASGIFERASKATEESIANLRSDQLRRVIEKVSPELAERLPEFEENTKNRQRQLKERTADTKRRLSGAMKDLEKLADRLG